MVRLRVGKYENTPCNERGILNFVVGKNTEWSSIVGSVTWIFAVSFTSIPASRNIKGGIRLCAIDDTYSTFLTIKTIGHISERTVVRHCTQTVVIHVIQLWHHSFLSG